jgi:hypothetical protein
VAAEPAPARPEDHRDHEADQADDHQDDADVVHVDALGLGRDAPREDRTDGDQQKTD